MTYTKDGVVFIKLDPIQFSEQKKTIEAMLAANERVGVQLLMSNKDHTVLNCLDSLPVDIWGVHLGQTFKQYNMHEILYRFVNLNFLNIGDEKTNLDMNRFPKLKIYIGPWSSKFKQKIP